MADKEHLKILGQGVEAWNQWRKENYQIKPRLRLADLRDANLSEANLRRANLNMADLRKATLCRAVLNEANLQVADLRFANLSGANLSDANLMNADLSGADLREANFVGADLRDTNLSEADFSFAIVGWTIFGNVDLSKPRNLDNLAHLGPSTVGIDTIYRSNGNIPQSFLTGTGVPEDFVTYMKSLIGPAIEFFSCFNSSMEYSPRSFCLSAWKLHKKKIKL